MKILLTLPLLAILLPLCAVARPKAGSKGPKGAPPEVLAKYDTDGDGALSDAEKAAMKTAMEAERLALIAKYDANGDGKLNAAERATLAAAKKAEHEAAKLKAATEKFNAADGDKDGSLTQTEFAAIAPAGAPADKVAAHFAKVDADSSSGISLAEFTAAKPPRGPRQ